MAITDSLLSISRGTVTAPAGCGKTYLIAKSLSDYSGKRPVLILTHTNAGVASLRTQLKKFGVGSQKFKLYTIDGYSIALVSTFPARSNIDPSVLNLRNLSNDYLAIKKAAADLIESCHISDIISNSYAHLFVDEYQDCSLQQHRFICGLAKTIPTCVLGDPMQAIFDFNEPLADWNSQVLDAFPHVSELSIPWRWKNAGSDCLGEWLLDARVKLQQGGLIDLRTLPSHVQWHSLNSTSADHGVILRAAQTKSINTSGKVLILCDSKNRERQRKLASQIPGASVIESVDLRDFIDFGESFKIASQESLEDLLEFSQSVMTNTNISGLKKRIETLENGTYRKEPTNTESCCLAYRASPSYESALSVLYALKNQLNVRVFRPFIFSSCVKALKMASGGNMGFAQATTKIREQYRAYGRDLPMRGVGSTLLLKGLETDIAVVVDPSSMNARNLYVAMTRGSEKLVVCSQTSTLRPASS